MAIATVLHRPTTRLSDVQMPGDPIVSVANQIVGFANAIVGVGDRTTPIVQAMISAKAIEAIDKNPTLKTRVLNALKEGGTVALETAIDHPAVKPFVAMLNGFLDAK